MQKKDSSTQIERESVPGEGAGPSNSEEAKNLVLVEAEAPIQPSGELGLTRSLEIHDIPISDLPDDNNMELMPSQSDIPSQDLHVQPTPQSNEFIESMSIQNLPTQDLTELSTSEVKQSAKLNPNQELPSQEELIPSQDLLELPTSDPPEDKQFQLATQVPPQILPLTPSPKISDETPETSVSTHFTRNVADDNGAGPSNRDDVRNPEKEETTSEVDQGIPSLHERRIFKRMRLLPDIDKNSHKNWIYRRNTGAFMPAESSEENDSDEADQNVIDSHECSTSEQSSDLEKTSSELSQASPEPIISRDNVQQPIENESNADVILKPEDAESKIEEGNKEIRMMHTDERPDRMNLLPSTSRMLRDSISPSGPSTSAAALTYASGLPKITPSKRPPIRPESKIIKRTRILVSPERSTPPALPSTSGEVPHTSKRKADSTSPERTPKKQCKDLKNASSSSSDSDDSNTNITDKDGDNGDNGDNGDSGDNGGDGNTGGAGNNGDNGGDGNTGGAGNNSDNGGDGNAGGAGNNSNDGYNADNSDDSIITDDDVVNEHDDEHDGNGGDIEMAGLDNNIGDNMRNNVNADREGQNHSFLRTLFQNCVIS